VSTLIFKIFNQTNSLNLFTADMYGSLKTEKNNLLFSPLSIGIALSICTEGAKGMTKNEINNVLHLDSIGSITDYSKKNHIL